MRILSAAEVEAALDWESLIERLRQTFRRGAEAPPGHHHDIADPAGAAGRLSLAPAWQSGRHIGVRIATDFPDNPARGLPAAMGAYLLLDGRNGAPVALIDGPMLTLKRTAAASALASHYLSRPDCERLLMVGTGALAPYLVTAHAAVRPICNVLIWGRRPAAAVQLAKRLGRPDFRVAATEDLESAARGAHVICCATASREPLIRGRWLQPGQHLDLVGARGPEGRESDPAALARARVFVDSRAAAPAAGDIVQAVADGAFHPEDIAGDLFELTRGERAGRRFYDQITLFKSVGSALADLAAAQLAVERC